MLLIGAADQDRRTDRQQARLQAAFTADDRHVEVEVAYRCAQKLRARSITRAATPPGAGSPDRSWPISPAARSPRPPASAGP